MCWTNKIANACVARENIEIFKICERCTEEKIIMSYFMLSKYTLNKVYKLDSPIKVEQFTTCYGINRGFHSYDKTCEVKHSYSNIVITNGYCSIETYCDYAIVVKGYIPKGATYYINSKKEYVSDEICLTEIEELQ